MDRQADSLGQTRQRLRRRHRHGYPFWAIFQDLPRPGHREGRAVLVARKRVLDPADPKPPASGVVRTSGAHDVVLPQRVVTGSFVDEGVHPSHLRQHLHAHIVGFEHHASVPLVDDARPVDALEIQMRKRVAVVVVDCRFVVDLGDVDVVDDE